MFDNTNNVCTNTQIGSNFSVGSNDKAIFNGLDGVSKYCIKQVKTTSGYSLNTTTAIIEPGTDFSTLNQNGYYEVIITNEESSTLPSTGGVGTIIFTAIGLLIIVGSSLFLINSKKKKIVTAKES